MEPAATRMEGMSSINASDFVYEAVRGAGKVGGYVHNILTDTMYYAGKTVALIRSVCLGFKGSPHQDRSEEGKITLVHLLKKDAAIDEADKREFYMNLGRDMVELTKSGVESENLTIIDLSRYKM
jgi:hypothetical protein